jgi:hypothetical protein
MEIFRYPDAVHVRRHGPRGYRHYASYKPWLRDEFAYQCVYCLCRERWFPDGEAAFSVDHLRPQTSMPDLRTAYDNLVYTCCQCNAVRGISPAPDPSEHAYGRHLRVRDNGLVEALTPTGRELIEICRLNRSNLVSFRRGVLEVLTFLRQRRGAHMDVLVRNYLGFPASLPNLAILRPPAGNSRPGGLQQSYYARRSRGELPDTY